MVSNWLRRNGIDGAFGVTTNFLELAGKGPVPVCIRIPTADPLSRVGLSRVPAQSSPRLAPGIELSDRGEASISRYGALQSGATDSQSSIRWLVLVEGIVECAAHSVGFQGRTVRG
jgi:hypothetical protein